MPGTNEMLMCPAFATAQNYRFRALVRIAERGFMNEVGSYVRGMGTWLSLSLLFAQPGVSQDRGTALESARQITEATVRIPQGTLLQIELAQRTDWKHLERNSVVKGRLMLPVFAGNDIAIPEQTKVSLTIESVKKEDDDSRTWKKAGHAVVGAFNPLEKSRPAGDAVRVSKTDIESPRGHLVVAATALRAGYAAMVEPKIGRGGEGHNLLTPTAQSFRFRKQPP